MNSAKLLAMGDISLKGFGKTQFAQSPGYRALVQRMESYDGVTFANLECALTTSEYVNATKIALTADPALFQELPRVDIFSLANSHISDAWGQGVDDTIRVLNRYHKTYFGYGRDVAEARKPALVEKNGIRMGFLGYSCLSTNGQNYATQKTPGVCPIVDGFIREDVAKLKDHVDHVIVVLHWGIEYTHYPTPDQIAVAHRAIDSGASVVIGAHPHVIQGIERYNDGFICYSLGNLIFASRRSRASKESIGVEFTFEKQKVYLSATTAYKFDKYLLPTEVPLSSLRPDVRRISATLAAYVKNNSVLLRELNDPQLVVKFTNRKYGTYYLLRAVNEYRASVRAILFTKRALSKIARSIARLF